MDARSGPKAAAGRRSQELEGIQEENSILDRNQSSVQQSKKREVEHSSSNVLIKDEKAGVSNTPTSPPLEDEMKKPIIQAAVVQPASHSKKLESIP